MKIQTILNYTEDTRQDPRLGYELLKRVAAIMAERLHATRLQMLDVYGARG
jgi:CRP/FNR family cyclic AMP-dependent transcriptional regulator